MLKDCRIVVTDSLRGGGEWWGIGHCCDRGAAVAECVGDIMRVS